MNSSKTKKVRSDLDLPVKKKKRVVEEEVVPRKKQLKARILDISGDAEDDEDYRPDRRKKKVQRPLDAKRAPEAKRAVVKRELVLPKKLKRDNLPATFTEPPKQRISKLNGRKMKSILGDSAEMIHQMLEANENESATTLLQKRLLQEVLDLIPLAVNGVRKTKGQRGVYQVNSLITSIREIIIDIQSTKDKSALGETLVDKIIRPAFTDVAMEIIKEEELLKTFISSRVNPDVLREIVAEKHESIKRISALMQRKYEDAKEATINFMRQ